MSNEQRDRNVMAIVENIMNTFDDENETGMHIELEAGDVTEIITDMVKGLNVAVIAMTGQKKTNLEFTYMCNQLIVQDQIERIEKENEKNVK